MELPGFLFNFTLDLIVWPEQDLIRSLLASVCHLKMRMLNLIYLQGFPAALTSRTGFEDESIFIIQHFRPQDFDTK